MNTLRVLVMADDPLARAGLAALLADCPNCEVVGQVSDAAALADDLSLFEPDVIVWDTGWEPPEDALPGSLLEHISGTAPVVSLLPRGVDPAPYWGGGLRGRLLRDADVDQLCAALEAVAAGLVVIDLELAAELAPTPRSSSLPPADELTPREMEVLRLVAEGLSNRAIAQRLGISEHTVKFHVNAILAKLGAQSRTDAVVRATRLGLLLL